jgi:hypothetical protein
MEAGNVNPCRCKLQVQGNLACRGFCIPLRLQGFLQALDENEK